MADDRPIASHISPYLRRPLRSLKKAEQDRDASRRRLTAVPLVEPVVAVPRPSTSPNSAAGMPARTENTELRGTAGKRSSEC